MEYKIYVPTWGRKVMPVFLQIAKPQTITVVVRPEEKEKYQGLGFPVLSLPEDVIGIGAARHYIIRHSTADHTWMLDDDVINTNYLECVEWMSHHAAQRDARVFGLGNHFLANVRQEKWGEFSPEGIAASFWGIHTDSYRRSGLDMSEWFLHEDGYTWMGMQLRGHRVLISNYVERRISMSEPGGGGCSSYQEFELIMKMAQKFCDTYPEYVSLREWPNGKIQGKTVGYRLIRRWGAVRKEADRIRTLLGADYV